MTSARPGRFPDGELSYRYTRSGGPGGQHVNTSSTRVELTFDLEHSPTLTAAEKARARRRLRSRLDSEGKLRIVASDERSQARNRALAIERFRGHDAGCAEAAAATSPSHQAHPQRLGSHGSVPRSATPPASASASRPRATTDEVASRSRWRISTERVM